MYVVDRNVAWCLCDDRKKCTLGFIEKVIKTLGISVLSQLIDHHLNGKGVPLACAL